MESYVQMDAWRQVLLVVAAAAALGGTFMILRHGFKLLLWVLLLMIGVTGISLSLGGLPSADAILGLLQEGVEAGQPWAENIVRDLCANVQSDEPASSVSNSHLSSRTIATVFEVK